MSMKVYASEEYVKEMIANCGSGSGIDSTATGLLIEILQEAIFNSNVSGKILALKEALLAGGSGSGSGGSGDSDTETTTYTITNKLTNATNSNSSTVVNKGDKYSCTLRPNDGYVIKSVVVTMGGVVEESETFDGTEMYIWTMAAVTGNIVITVVAEVVESEPDEPEVIELPEGYTQLAYISNQRAVDSTSNTTASFDTGVVMTANTNAEYKINFYAVDTYHNRILVANEQNYFPAVSTNGWLAKKQSSTNQNVIGIDAPVINTDYVVSAFGSGNEVTINGVTATVIIGNTPSEDTLCLFGDTEQTNATIFHAKCKMYYCKIWEGDVLVRHFVPCSNPDNVIGMYDVVNGNFYDSDTDKVFIGGDPV